MAVCRSWSQPSPCLRFQTLADSVSRKTLLSRCSGKGVHDNRLSRFLVCHSPTAGCRQSRRLLGKMGEGVCLDADADGMLPHREQPSAWRQAWRCRPFAAWRVDRDGLQCRYASSRHRSGDAAWLIQGGRWIRHRGGHERARNPMGVQRPLHEKEEAYCREREEPHPYAYAAITPTDSSRSRPSAKHSRKPEAPHQAPSTLHQALIRDRHQITGFGIIARQSGLLREEVFGSGLTRSDE